MSCIKMFITERKPDRVKAVSADVALTNFGLSEEYYHFLTYDIDVVIHAAAYVNLIYPYQALHGVNVLGTRNVLDFCHGNKIKPLHYISTDGVISTCLTNVDDSFSIETCKNNLQDGYGQSKYVAEQLVNRALSRGLPAIIYRLGNQAADTILGRWNEQDFTYLILRAVIMIGQAPKVDWTVELTPVDFSSKFVTEITTNLFVGNVGKTFHLINTNGPKFSEILNWLRKFGYTIEDVDFNVWKERILNSSDKNLHALQKLIEVMINEKSFFSSMSTFKRTNTDHILKDISWKYPLVDETLVKFWLNHLIEQGIIHSPKVKKAIGHMLRGKVCIVTGASEGIGEAIVKTLAVDGGATVILASRQLQKMQGIVEALCNSGCSSNDVLALKCDIVNRKNVEDVIKTVMSRYGKIDVLVNCAGLMYYTLMKNMKIEEWSSQIDVNCHGTTNITGAVLPHMIEQRRGHILNITSDAGKRGFAGLAVYSGTKFYIEGFMQALRQEVLEYGIRITNIQPGDVATKLASRSTDEEARSKYDGSNAGHSILDPEDVAKTVFHVLAQPQHVAINELLIEPQAAPI